MTNGELIDLLSQHPRDHLIVMSKDAEGNSHSPLWGLCLGHYEADATYSGAVTYPDCECFDPDAGVPAIILAPIN
ncbi:hypothetical protein [Nocardia grenadensis]|uniref:hypothetical protein n=1 Tax=Nocardia grenadensis TaxID=931537 RepID=UPI0007A3CDEC|nr:hypothetical protein [Nocardia grenadensis]